METDAALVKDRVKKLYEQGHFCSKITAIVLQDILDLRNDEVIKAMTAFSGGIGRNGTSCGALNGALAVLGQLLGYAREGKDDPRLSEYIRKVNEGFKLHATKDYGSIDCRDIVGVDWWNAQEALSYLQDDSKKNECRQIIVETIMHASGILREVVAMDRSSTYPEDKQREE